MRYKERTTPYNNGIYGCLKSELMSVIEDLDNDEQMFVVSVKTSSGTIVYGFPSHLDKCRRITNEMVDYINDKKMYKLGTTWINPDHVATIRICKYIGDEFNEY